MKFDYIIGNPPYQENDGGACVSAIPLYDKFVDSAKNLDPKSFSFIIPAKWYSGGKGLGDFRRSMLTDRHITILEDYTDSQNVFSGVDVAGGVCYFVWNRDHNGDCLYTCYDNGLAMSAVRDLTEFETFIRYPIASDIVKKVMANGEGNLSHVVSARKPFGLATNVQPLESGDILLRYNKGLGHFKRELVSVGIENIDRFKVIISYLTSEHAGQPDRNGQYRVLSAIEKLPRGSVCSETYLVAGAFDSEYEADNYMQYLKTRFVRFLILLQVMTQHISRSMFSFVPVPDVSRSWTDYDLFQKYGLSSDEIEFIKSHIKEISHEGHTECIE